MPVRFVHLTIGIFAASCVSILLFLLVPRGRGPSKEAVAALLRAHPKFTTTRIAVVPRLVYVNPGVRGGQLGEPSLYTSTELGFIAPGVAALKALQLVDVTEYIGPPDTVNLPINQRYMSDSDRVEALRSSAYAHTLTVRPREALIGVSGFDEAGDEADRDEAGEITVVATPGWRFPIAVRELVKVTGVQPSPRPLRDFDATVCWRWRPLPAGELFAVGSDTYDRIPDVLWNDAPPLENERGKNLFFDTDLHAWLARITRKNERWEISLFASLDEAVSVEHVCARR